MKNSTKAFCLSAFVYPGAGHFHLKCYFRSAIFILIASAGLFFILAAVFEIASGISSGIVSGHVEIDILAIRKTIYSSLMAYDDQTFTTAKWAIVISWVLSSADAFREGHRQEKIKPPSQAI